MKRTPAEPQLQPPLLFTPYFSPFDTFSFGWTREPLLGRCGRSVRTPAQTQLDKEEEH
jgi:hypothetical protein